MSVYVCHDVCPDDLTMRDWCHTNIILQVHCSGCLVVQGPLRGTHDVIGDVTTSQRRSNFEIDISPSIFELQHRSKVQNVGNANGYFFWYIQLPVSLPVKRLLRIQNGSHFENLEMFNTASI